MFEVYLIFADLKSSAVFVEFGSTRNPEILKKKVDTMYSLAASHVHALVKTLIVICIVANMTCLTVACVVLVQLLSTCVTSPVVAVKLMWSTESIAGM